MPIKQKDNIEKLMVITIIHKTKLQYNIYSQTSQTYYIEKKHID